MTTFSEVDLHQGDLWGLLFWVILGSLADPGPVGSQGGKVKMMYRYGLGRAEIVETREAAGGTGHWNSQSAPGGGRERSKVSRTRRKESRIKYWGNLVQLVGWIGSGALDPGHYFSDEKGVSSIDSCIV